MKGRAIDQGAEDGGCFSPGPTNGSDEVGHPAERPFPQISRLMNVNAEWSGSTRQLRWDSLSPAELRILELICEGLTNPQIAERLFLSRRTVQSHLYNIFKKLGVTSRTELAALAVRSGLGG